MKPLLKSYVLFVPVDDGVQFEAGQDSFLLKGRGIFPLVTRMVGLFDGTRMAAELESIIPEKARPLFRLLLAELERKHMVHMVPDAVDLHPGQDLEALYAGTIGYLKDQIPNWPAAFRRWRETPIMAAGGGLSYRVMVRNLLGSGVRRLLLALDASEDQAADRSAIAASVAEASGRDPQIQVQWLDPASAVADAAGGDARIVYVSDAVPVAEDSLFRRLIGLNRPGTLAGGIVRGIALVGPESGQGVSPLSTWERFPAEETALPYPRAARAILGSVVAYEALKSLVFDESTQAGQRGWLQAHFYHVRPDTTIQVHNLAPIEDSQPAVPAPPEGPAAESTDAALFDPAMGSLRWVEYDGVEFPLPHRAIAIRTAASGAFVPDPVSQWALTSEDLDERTTARALEALAEADCPAAPAGSGFSLSPVIAARDEAIWRAEARAHAVARHAAFLGEAAPFLLDPESVPDEDARTLFRLVRLYTGSIPRTWLLGGSGWDASVACVAVDGRLARSAAATPGRAIVEALGDALSEVQTGHSPGRQRQPFLGALAGIRPAADRAPMALAETGSGGTIGFRFEEVRLSPGGVASDNWVVGRVQAFL